MNPEWELTDTGIILASARPEVFMRSIILYILGVPITIIILIALFTHHF